MVAGAARGPESCGGPEAQGIGRQRPTSRKAATGQSLELAGGRLSPRARGTAPLTAPRPRPAPPGVPRRLAPGQARPLPLCAPAPRRPFDPCAPSRYEPVPQASSRMAYDPTAAAGAAPSWTVPEKFLSWDVDHTRFEMKRVLGKGESLRRAETARLARQARQAKPTAQGGGGCAQNGRAAARHRCTAGRGSSSPRAPRPDGPPVLTIGHARNASKPAHKHPCPAAAQAQLPSTPLLPRPPSACDAALSSQAPTAAWPRLWTTPLTPLAAWQSSASPTCLTCLRTRSASTARSPSSACSRIPTSRASCTWSGPREHASLRLRPRARNSSPGPATLSRRLRPAPFTHPPPQPAPPCWPQ